MCHQQSNNAYLVLYLKRLVTSLFLDTWNAGPTTSTYNHSGRHAYDVNISAGESIKIIIMRVSYIIGSFITIPRLKKRHSFNSPPKAIFVGIKLKTQ